MKNTLLVIDSYLSNVERAYYCENLIAQIRNHFPEYKILLINKSKESFSIEKKVDYYFNFGDSFMVGMPPQSLLNSGAYSKPYVYFGTSIGTLENWMPLTGITDHVAGIYNSFVLSAKMAKTLGFSKVFKFEFDTVFDENELKTLKTEIESFEDYILYGTRHEGKWSRYDLVDTHIIGFSPKVFEGYELVRNDDEYWEVCTKSGYHGKWIEYLIPAILDQRKKEDELKGMTFEGNLKDKYTLTKFDTVNSPGGWTEKWREIPAIGRISLDGGVSELQDRLCVFFYNNDFEKINVETKIYKEDKVIFHVNRELYDKSWFYDEIKLDSELNVISEYTSNDGYHKKMEYTISPESINNLRYRILKS